MVNIFFFFDNIMSVKIIYDKKIENNEIILDLNIEYSLKDLLKLFTEFGTIHLDPDIILLESKNKNVNLIRKNYMLLFSYLYLKKYIILSPVDSNYELATHYKKVDMSKKYFIGRYGVIELRMLENYLKFGTSYIKNIDDIFIEYNPEKLKQYQKQYRDYDWFGCDTPVFALHQICTLAGFYCTNNDHENNEKVLKSWCQSYLDGLMNMTYFIRTRQCKLFYLYINKFCDHKEEISLNLDAIFAHTNNKNICVISYFANEIKDLYDNGKIFKLYKDRNFAFNKLYTIKSYITTYGNHPHCNWLDTYNILCGNIDDLIKNENIDLFMINAGCYGIPLGNYVFTKHNISVIHMGHALNGYFGIITDRNHLQLDNINKENFIEATKDFYKDIKGLEYWSNEGYWKT